MSMTNKEYRQHSGISKLMKFYFGIGGMNKWQMK